MLDDLTVRIIQCDKPLCSMGQILLILGPCMDRQRWAAVCCYTYTPTTRGFHVLFTVDDRYWDRVKTRDQFSG